MTLPGPATFLRGGMELDYYAETKPLRCRSDCFPQCATRRSQNLCDWSIAGATAHLNVQKGYRPRRPGSEKSLHQIRGTARLPQKDPQRIDRGLVHIQRTN